VAGFGAFEHAQRAEAAGFDAYMVKPVDAAQLRRVLGPARAPADDLPGVAAPA
jgi:YesN/AraC family two-component response regulator